VTTEHIFMLDEHFKKKLCKNLPRIHSFISMYVSGADRTILCWLVLSRLLDTCL